MTDPGNAPATGDPTPTDPTPTDPAPTDPSAGDPDDLGDAGKKALAAERRRATLAEKQAKELAAQIKELQDKDKSEADKLRDEKDAAKRDADAANLKALRLETAIAKKLPMSLASRLQGETKEEMEADADTLLAELKPGSPTGDAEGGKRGKTPDPSTDMNALLHAAVKGK